MRSTTLLPRFPFTSVHPAKLNDLSTSPPVTGSPTKFPGCFRKRARPIAPQPLNNFGCFTRDSFCSEVRPSTDRSTDLSNWNGSEGQICKFLQLRKKKSDPQSCNFLQKKTANNSKFLMFFGRGQICEICKKLQLADFAPLSPSTSSLDVNSTTLSALTDVNLELLANGHLFVFSVFQKTTGVPA